MPEQKTEIVHKHLDEHISVKTLEKQHNADCSMICHWVKRYISVGESSFVHKWHPGNKFAALHVNKKPCRFIASIPSSSPHTIQVFV